jgi:hypothetical protein
MHPTPSNILQNRPLTHSAYRYAFQAQERDDEVKGEGNSINYTYRMHDTRLGRFFAVDPLFAQYAYNSTYAFSENRVIDRLELEGAETIQIKEINNTGRVYVQLISASGPLTVLDADGTPLATRKSLSNMVAIQYQGIMKYSSLVQKYRDATINGESVNPNPGELPTFSLNPPTKVTLVAPFYLGSSGFGVSVLKQSLKPGDIICSSCLINDYAASGTAVVTTGVVRISLIDEKGSSINTILGASTSEMQKFGDQIVEFIDNIDQLVQAELKVPKTSYKNSFEIKVTVNSTVEQSSEYRDFITDLQTKTLGKGIKITIAIDNNMDNIIDYTVRNNVEFGSVPKSD